MKKLSIILLISALLPVMASAQRSYSSLGQQMIELAVQNGVVLLRQDYQLEDTLTMKRYSVNNNPEFGSAVSFCVITENGYITSKKALTPWEYDSKFDKYRNSQYRPVLSKTYRRSIKDDEFQEVGLTNPSAQQPMVTDEWMMVDDGIFNNQGFAIDTLSGKKDGWLVWLINSGEEIESGNLSITTYQQGLTVKPHEATYKIPAPSLNQNVIGGIYIEPQYTGIGKIEFALVGIVVKNEDEWQMVRCANDFVESGDADETDGDLTIFPA